VYANRDQIERAAYHRWERSGGRHGRDRDDWVAAERDLAFALNYRWVARVALDAKDDVRPNSPPRRCRFCEQAAPSATFTRRAPVAPALLGAEPPRGWDECDDCRAHYDECLAAPFQSFAAPFLAAEPAHPRAGATVPVAALKALARFGLAVMPEEELHHFADTLEWVANPDHERDAAPARADGLGCQVYITPVPVGSPFLSLARRVSDDAPVPYMLVFLGNGRAVFQTRLPLSPRDEDLDDSRPRPPILSMSLGAGAGTGGGVVESVTAFLPVADTAKARVRSLRERAGAAATTNA
jgi:hypothetical protein